MTLLLIIVLAAIAAFLLYKFDAKFHAKADQEIATLKAQEQHALAATKALFHAPPLPTPTVSRPGFVGGNVPSNPSL